MKKKTKVLNIARKYYCGIDKPIYFTPILIGELENERNKLKQELMNNEKLIAFTKFATISVGLGTSIC